MYESWFSLSNRPFQAAPQAVSYFPNDVFESACEGLWRCIQRNAGPGVVVGEHGTGKSLMSLLMANQFQSSWSIVRISAPNVRSRKELIQTILFELGLPYVASDEGELRLSLLDYLTSTRLNHEGTLLIIDDCHDLSIELLEQVASLSGLVREGRWCIDLVMLGTTAMEEKLAHPALTSLSQRIAARYYLRPWPSHVTANYVRHQLAQAGGDANALFDSPALQQIHDLARGVPRLVNQLCDHSLILAAAGGVRQIKAEMVLEAWSDLQQLPKENPACVISSPVTQDDPIVEFGSLEDEFATHAQRPQPVHTSTPSNQTTHTCDPMGAEDTISVHEVAEQTILPAVSRAVEHESPLDTWKRVFERAPAGFGEQNGPNGLDLITEDSTNRVLDEIEQRLLEASSDLQNFSRQSPAKPLAASFRPGNPFYETFAEEEIVISRNCLPEVDWTARLPIVKTTRGTELIDTLKMLEFEDDCGEALLDGYLDEHDARYAEGEFGAPRQVQVEHDAACVGNTSCRVATPVTTADALTLELRTAQASGDLEPSQDTQPTQRSLLDSPAAVMAAPTVCLAGSYSAENYSTSDRFAQVAEIRGGGESQVILATPDHVALSYENHELTNRPQELDQPAQMQASHPRGAEPQLVRAPWETRNSHQPSGSQPIRQRKFSRLFSNLKRQ